MNRILFFLSLPFLSAVLAAIAIYRKPTPALHARRWLVRSMICGALSVALLAHYYHPVWRYSIFLDLTFDAVLLCLAPCFYLCLLSLTSLRGIQRRDYLVFAPGAALMALIVLLNLLMGVDEAHAALEEIVLRTSPLTEGHSWAFQAYAFFGHQFYRSFAILSILAVFYWGAWAIHDYRSRLEDYLVDISPSLTKGIRCLYISFAIFASVGMLFAACEYAQTLVEWVIPLFSIGIALSFAMMGYCAGQVRYSAEMIVAAMAGTPIAGLLPETTSIGDTDVVENVSEVDPFKARLAVIEREHLYRNPNLTIFSLSRMIGTNRTYLTRAFRECYGESFSEHINRLRIDETILLLHHSPRLTLSEIAAQVGYNSSTSLYRNFVRIHHVSPTEYMAQSAFATHEEDSQRSADKE